MSSNPEAPTSDPSIRPTSVSVLVVAALAAAAVMAEAGDPGRLPLARSVAAAVVSPALHARLAALAN